MPHPAKVLFLINTLRVGGTERNVAALCKSIDRSRFVPEVWVLHGGGQYEAQVVASGISLRNLGRGWARNPLFAWKAAREISRSDADLIHVFLPSIGGYAAMARRWFGVEQPIVLSLGQSHTIPRERWILRWCARTFDWLIVNSPAAEEFGRSQGFAPHRISLIPNGHDVDRYCLGIDRGAVRASIGVGPDEHLFLCVSRLIDTKRVCDVVAAIDLIGRDLPVKLVVVGDGPERSALIEEVARRKLNERVVFTGQRNDVADLLQAADAFVFPSEREGLPNALIEACLAGLPVVACRASGVLDVVQDGESAVLVAPRSPADLAGAMRYLVTHPGDAGRLATTARKRARSRYSIEQSLDRLYDVYESLITQRRSPARRAAGVPQVE